MNLTQSNKELLELANNHNVKIRMKQIAELVIYDNQFSDSASYYLLKMKGIDNSFFYVYFEKQETLDLSMVFTILAKSPHCYSKGEAFFSLNKQFTDAILGLGINDLDYNQLRVKSDTIKSD